MPESRYLEIDLRADGQEHFEFVEPVEVTIGYTRCARHDLDQHSLSAWEIDPDTKVLLEGMPSRDDKDHRAVTFTTTHFSNFAIAN
ncbi:MAG: hypothetical protein GWO02_05710 [Gammaproteobacteria bacterium]|nr:hypothetical protein [Gammaproteobacteria bacterium]